MKLLIENIKKWHRKLELNFIWMLKSLFWSTMPTWVYPSVGRRRVSGLSTVFLRSRPTSRGGRQAIGRQAATPLPANRARTSLARFPRQKNAVEPFIRCYNVFNLLQLSFCSVSLSTDISFFCLTNLNIDSVSGRDRMNLISMWPIPFRIIHILCGLIKIWCLQDISDLFSWFIYRHLMYSNLNFLAQSSWVVTIYFVFNFSTIEFLR